MELTMKKIVLIVSAIITNGMYGATIQEVKQQEKEAYDALIDIWINANGDVRVGGNKKDAQFTFDEPFLARRSIDQINKSIKTALAGLTVEQQEKFKKAIEDDFKKLEKARADLKGLRSELDTAVALLASYWKKTPEAVMKLADINLDNLGPNNPNQAQKIAFNSDQKRNEALQAIKTLRPFFNIQTTTIPITTAQKTKPSMADNEEDHGTEFAGKTEKTSASKGSGGSKTTAIAEAIMNSETKLSGLIKASADIKGQWTCESMHFDIVPGDEPGSVLFLRLVQ
jgi:hypothetical protein